MKTNSQKENYHFFRSTFWVILKYFFHFHFGNIHKIRKQNPLKSRFSVNISHLNWIFFKKHTISFRKTNSNDIPKQPKKPSTTTMAVPQNCPETDNFRQQNRPLEHHKRRPMINKTKTPNLRGLRFVGVTPRGWWVFGRSTWRDQISPASQRCFFAKKGEPRNKPFGGGKTLSIFGYKTTYPSPVVGMIIHRKWDCC